MTELDKLPSLEEEEEDELLQKEPDFKAFSDWKTDNSSGDIVRDRVNWGNYVREQYVDANLYGDYVEKEIRDTTVQRFNELVETEQINPEDLNKRLYEIDAESDTDLDSKLKSIQSTFDYKTAEWETASKYLTFKEYNPEGEELDEVTRQRGEELFSAAQSVADRYYDDAKRRMALSGEIPIAKITGEDGKPEFIIGPSFNKDNLGDAIRNSKRGDVSFADASGVVAKTRIPKGYNEEVYKVQRYLEAGSVIETIWGETSNSILDRYADKLAEADVDGRDLTENEQPDFAQIRKDVNKMLPENEGFSDEEVKKAFTQIAYLKANGGQKFKVYEDEEAYKNVRNVGFAGPLVNPLVMANEEKFLQSINASPQLTEEQRKDLTAQRTPFLQQNFDHYNKTLTESDLSEKWLNALQAGRAGGQKDYEILDAFSKDKTNFSEMSARLSGIGESIQDAFGELGAAIPMLAGADWARDYMIGNIKERSNRTEVARLFGTEFGVGQQFMETVAPMLVDIGATALLTGVTSPIGSAAYLSAKAGARLTAKGLMKGVATSAFRQLPEETTEQAAKRVLAAGLIKESTTEAGMTGAMKAIGAYNSSLASSIGTTSAMAIPAFNRSAGSTYASVYAQLQADGKLSPEEMHDRALGAGLTSGAITAAITSGFASLGRAGIEDALLGGASKSQLKNIFSKISKVDDIADDEFDAVVSSVVSDSLKKFGAPNLSTQVLKNSFDEGAEEALDDFINGFVSDAATDQDTPFLQRLEQAGRSALIGAGMGAGVPAIKAVRDTVVRQGTTDQRLSAQYQVSREISDRLAETSPISAQTVFTILTAPRSGRAEFARTKLAEARATVSPPQVAITPPVGGEATPTEGTTVKEQAGADENESSPVVVTPQSLVNAGKPAEAVPESGTVTPETTAPNQQAAPVTLNLKEEVESALANPVVINGNNVEFAEIPYKHKFAEDPDSPVTEQTGQARAVNMAGRPVVVAVINGVRVPFYQSTGYGGKADVAPKKWYPVFGVSDGWFNKTSGAQINNYYGSQELRDVAEYLDNNVGNVLGVNVQRTSYSDDTPQINAINEGLAPTPNNTPETKQRLTDNINSVVQRLAAARPAVQQQVAEQTVAAGQAVAEEVEAQTPIAAKVPKTRKERVNKIKQALQEVDEAETKEVLKTIINEGEAEVADPPKIKEVPPPIEEGETVTPPVITPPAEVTPPAPAVTAPKKQPKAKAAKAVAEPQAPTETAPAAPTVIAPAITPPPSNPKDALNISSEEESNLNKNALSEGLDQKKATKHVRKAMLKMGILKPETDVAPPKQEVAQPEAPVKKQKPATLMGEALSEMVDSRLDFLADNGVVARIKKSSLYGLPANHTEITESSDLSNKLAERVFERYKPLTTKEVSELYDVPIAVMSSKRTPDRSWWNPFTKSFVQKEKIQYNTVREDGVEIGLFDNNPLTVAMMLQRRFPVYVPTNFTGEVNKAIKVDWNTRTIRDVRYPDPFGGPNEVSIAFPEETDKEKPEIANTVADQLELISGFKLPLDSKIKIDRDLTNLAETNPVEGDPFMDYYKALDQVNRFFDDVYSNIGEAPVDEKRRRKVGPSRAFLKLLGFDDPKRRLSNAEISTAKSLAMLEVIPEFNMTLIKGELYQSLERDEAINFDSTKSRNQYSIVESKADSSRETLLSRIKVPTDFAIPKELEGKSDLITKAYFLLDRGFKTGQVVPKINDDKITTKNLNDQSANTVIDQFIFNSINDNLSRPDKKGMFPDVAGIVKRSSNRIMDRIKNGIATAKDSDTFDRLQIDSDMSGANVDSFNKELAEIYGVVEATVDNIHSSLDSLKAENVYRGIHRDLDKLLRSDETVSGSMRSLAKNTVFKNDPTLADDMSGVQLFREVALWASYNKQTTADSFRFRRQLLDNFPSASISSGLVHDAFEASGAFQFNFKRVADKNTINMLIRNGFSEQDAKFVLERRNIKRIVDETGVTEQEAESIMRSQLRAQSSYAAPSFIDAKHRQYYRQLNLAEVGRLGLESGNEQSVVEALRKIAKNGRTEQNKAVAQLILRFQNVLRDTKFNIVDIRYNKAGEFIRGQNGTNRVLINMSGFYGSGVESVLLHEYIHAITHTVIARPDAELTPAQRGAKARLKGLLQLASKEYNDNLQKTGVGSVEFEAATVNLDEFVATFFSSVQFQNQLKVLRQTNQKARNFFARIYDAILDIFGIKKNSSLDNAFDALVDLVEVGNVKGRSSLAGFVDKSLMEARNNGARRRIVPVRRAISDADIEARLSSFEGVYDGEDASPEEQAAIDTMIDQAVKNLIPSNIDVTIFDTQKEADDNGIFGDRPDAAIIAVLMKDSTGRSIPTVFINRANMRSAMLARNSVIENPVMAKGILESVLNEEMFHIAEFYALSQEEVAAVAGTMADVEFDEIIDQYTSNESRREQIKQALRGDNGAEVKNQLVGEMLRMRAQMITRGYTSEQDIAFFETNPSLMSLAFRYFRGFFRRMYARYNLNKNNPELAASIHLMATELNFLRQGTYNPDTHASFDANNPDANMEILRKRFSAMAKDINEETTDDEIMERFQGLFDSLELPVSLFSRGEYKHMSTKMEQWMKGEVDPRVSRLHKQMKFFEQAADALGKSLMTRIEKLIKQTYGANGIDPSVLADATGTTQNIYIDKELKNKFRQEFTDAFKSRKDRVINGELDPKWVDADHQAAMRKAMITDRVEAETLKLRQEVRAKQAAALDKISKDSPQLAAALVDMRKMTDAMSKVIKDKYNLSEQLQIKFDNNMGIYLTRAYRAFNEEGYIEKVLESKDPKFVEIRQEASEYFRETYIKRLTSTKYNASIKSSKITGKTPITKEEARELATLELESNPAIVAQFMAQFLRSYSPDYHRRAGVLPKGVTKSLINNLRRKGALDPRVRKLLGEYEQETEGVNNLLRTYSLVSGMVARQSFYNNLIQMAGVRPVLDPSNKPVLDADGEPVQDGFLLTEDQLRERMKKNPMMQQEYVNLRTGRIYTPDTEEQVPAGLEGQYDPTYNYYGPKEMIEGMRRMYAPPMLDENLTGAQRATAAVVNTFNGITGISLATKTLGSLPFYLRNIVSNMFFFAPAQGFFGYGRMAKSLKLVVEKANIGGTFSIDAYQAELISLGILNNEMTSSLVKDMLKGNFQSESVNEEINTILGKIKEASAKGVTFVKPLTDKLQALSASVDGFYKMAYFEHELDILRKAKDADVKAGNKDSFYSKLTDYEMKREAARKVLATAQSYSESPPIVQEAVRSVGMFIAPFLRFKTEVPRIVMNTYKEGFAEFKSGNPVIAKRGMMRVGFMTTWLAGVSATVPTAIRMLLGIGEDEDEFLRSTVPSYLRDNTFFYYEPFFDKGKLKSADFTFLNPFSSVIDPIMRSAEHIFRGEPSDAVVAFTRSFLGTYLDEQIFTGAVADVYRNKDADTNQPIYYDADGLQIFTKGIGYVVSKAFLPRALEKSWDAVKSTVGEAPETDQQLFGILAGELKPFKPHDIDIKKQLSRFLKQKRDERNDYSYRKNELKTPKTLTDIEIRGLAKDFVESRIRIDEELYRGLRSVSKLPIIGLSEREIVAQMREKDVNMGQRRTMLLQNKLTEKPMLDPSFIQDVLALEGGVGQRRLQVFQQEIDRLFPARFMPLNP
jgi:hypothetical protein